MDTSSLIIRVRFRSGSVSEQLGTNEHCVALLDQDDEGLIDYVQTLDPLTGEFSLYVHDNSPSWTDESLDRLFGG